MILDNQVVRIYWFHLALDSWGFVVCLIWGQLQESSHQSYLPWKEILDNIMGNTESIWYVWDKDALVEWRKKREEQTYATCQKRLHNSCTCPFRKANLNKSETNLKRDEIQINIPT